MVATNYMVPRLYVGGIFNLGYISWCTCRHVFIQVSRANQMRALENVAGDRSPAAQKGWCSVIFPLPYLSLHVCTCVLNNCSHIWTSGEDSWACGFREGEWFLVWSWRGAREGEGQRSSGGVTATSNEGQTKWRSVTIGIWGLKMVVISTSLKGEWKMRATENRWNEKLKSWNGKSWNEKKKGGGGCNGRGFLITGKFV